MKKLLTGLLALVMTITTVAIQSPITAKADSDNPVTTDGTINVNLKGSLTIHKYEYNGSEVITGTGSKDDSVPSGSNPLAGAGFTIYKVVELKDLQTYYSENPTNIPSVEEYVENGAIKSAYVNTKVGSEKITGADGIVSFEDLDLGLYVVVETTKPDAVTSPMTPFIVSIPMTETDGTDWLYDVHVFPKNGTKYGEVKLEKSGEDNAELSGVTFVLQKYVDSNDDNVDDEWKTITKKAGAAGDDTGDALNLTTGDSGLISVDGLTQGKYRFIETDRGDNYGYIVDGAATYEFEITNEGKVTYKGTTTETVTIPVTNEKPDLTKQVQDRSSSTTWGQDSDYNVGDTIPYKIIIDVPTNITSLNTFTVTDTPTHLQDNSSSIVLKYGANEEQATTLVPPVAYTVTTDLDNDNDTTNDYGFKITFDTTQMTDLAGQKIVITYNATLLSDDAVVTTEGNPNTAKLEYSNFILPEQDEDSAKYDPDNPNNSKTEGKDIIEDNAIVYTFEIDIVKRADSASGTLLGGVEFDLYKQFDEDDIKDINNDGIGDDDRRAAGVLTDEEATALGLDIGDDSATIYWTKINSDPLVTDTTTGKITYPGLANGTYYLVETKTVAGYNLLKAPVQVVLNIDYETTMKQESAWTWSDENGVKTFEKHEITQTTFTDADGDEVTSGIVVQTIVNKQGFTLPSTGGVGTYIFVFVGVSMMAAAVILFFTTKKKEAQKN